MFYANFSVSRVNLAVLWPTLRTSKVFVTVCLMGTSSSKLTLSAKSTIARAPIALTGTTNFSRSVTHSNSW